MARRGGHSTTMNSDHKGPGATRWKAAVRLHSRAFDGYRNAKPRHPDATSLANALLVVIRRAENLPRRALWWRGGLAIADDVILNDIE